MAMFYEGRSSTRGEDEEVLSLSSVITNNDSSNQHNQQAFHHIFLRLKNLKIGSERIFEVGSLHCFSNMHVLSTDKCVNLMRSLMF